MSEPSVERHIKQAKLHLVKAASELRKATEVALRELRKTPAPAAGFGAGRRHRAA